MMMVSKIIKIGWWQVKIDVDIRLFQALSSSGWKTDNKSLTWK